MRLLERPEVVIANKMDMDEAKENLAKFKLEYPDIKVFEAVTLINEGLSDALYYTADLLEKTPEFPLFNEESEDEGVLYKFETEKEKFNVVNEGNGRFRVEGAKIERMFAMVNLKNEESSLMFANQLRKIGVDEALREKGCKDGDTVFIMDYGFEFIDS